MKISSKLLKKGDKRLSGKKVRLISKDGQQLGIVDFDKALDMAKEAALDLVMVADSADPVVCRIMNFGKLRYEHKKRAREQRKNQYSHKLKEVKFRIRIEDHDYQYKINHAIEFLEKGHKVKATLMFRGREMAHKELGFELIKKVVEDLTEYGVPESEPKMMGRNIIVFFAPRGHHG